MDGKFLRKESNFDDAVCLGYGFFIGGKKEMQNHWTNSKNSQGKAK